MVADVLILPRRASESRQISSLNKMARTKYIMRCKNGIF